MKRIIVATLIGICLFTTNLWAQDQAPNDPLAEAMKGAVGLSVGDLSPKYGDTDPAAGGAGGMSPGDGSGAATGSTPASPQNRDPSSPEMSSLIKTWLILAEPPQNATKGANLRYSLRGNAVGRVPGGIITSRHETGGFDPVYLWTNKRKLDSINHCTMEEFVKARLEGRSISKCMGRYKPPQTSPLDNFKGLKVWDAKVAIKKKGLIPVVTEKGPAPEMKLQDAVLSQHPAPGARIKKGKRVKLTVYSDYVPLIKIPKVVEKSEARAKKKLESLGLKVLIHPGLPASSPAFEGRVEGTDPPEGREVKRGSKVVVKVHSPYKGPREVPDLIGMALSKAKTTLEEQGFAYKLHKGPAAPTTQKSGTIESQVPVPGSQMNTGGKIKLTFFSRFIELRKVPSIVGLSVEKAKAGLKAKGLTARLAAAGPAPSNRLSFKVKETKPGAGAKVKPGTQITLKVYGKYSIPLVTVPRITGLSAKKAKASLEAKGFKTRLVAAGSAPSNGQSFKVKETQPRAGTKVKPGTQITLKVYGKYSAPLVTVPRVGGLPFSQAKSTLAGAGLRASPKSAGPAPSQGKSSRIKSQEPGAGTKVKPGSLVKVYVFSKYVPPVDGRRDRRERDVSAGAWRLVNKKGPTITSQPGCRRPVFQGNTVHYLTEPDYGYWDFSFTWEEPPSVIVPDKAYSLKISSHRGRRGRPTGEAGVGAGVGIGVKGIRGSILKCYANGRDAKPNYFAWSGFKSTANGEARISLGPKDPDQFTLSLWMHDGGCAGALIGEYTYRRTAGASKAVAVPRLEGLSYAEAKRRLSSAGLTASPKDAGPAPSANKSSRVKSQKPRAGSKVTPGSKVNVYVFSKYVPRTHPDSGRTSGGSSNCDQVVGTWKWSNGWTVSLCPKTMSFSRNRNKNNRAVVWQGNRIIKAGTWYCSIKNGKAQITLSWGPRMLVRLTLSGNRLEGKRWDGGAVDATKINGQPNSRGSNGLNSDCDLIGRFKYRDNKMTMEITTRDGVNYQGKLTHVRSNSNWWGWGYRPGMIFFNLRRIGPNDRGGSYYTGQEWSPISKRWDKLPLVTVHCSMFFLADKDGNTMGRWQRIP